ncbi:MAG: hypothetical protein KAW66_15005, partial [Candidatus Lokiarchaeota archaeon]|nr:hypothetical protein [Candidatus Lokiarchaeota archaeon]
MAGEAELNIVDIIRKPTKKFYDLNYIEDIHSLPIPDRSFIRHIKYNRLQNIWLEALSKKHEFFASFLFHYKMMKFYRIINII